LDADVVSVRTRGLSRSGTLRRSARRAAVGKHARPGADQRATGWTSRLRAMCAGSTPAHW